MITLNDTHQQTKRLVDPVNGTYQTGLTIDPSVGWSDIVGTYICTVENDRGESSETVDIPGEICSLASVHIHSYHVMLIVIHDLKKKHVKRCRDGMAKSMQTRFATVM